MLKITYLLPYDCIGGVEIAARSIPSGRHGEIEIVVNYIYDEFEVKKSRWITFNPIALFTAARRISRSDAGLVITSLWRASIVGLLAKLMRPTLEIVTFLHSARDAHLIDFLVTRLSILFSREVWADSEATFRGRVPWIRAQRCRVISYLVAHFEALPDRAIKPSFIYWGRLNKVKHLERAIGIFSLIRKIRADAIFTIIGPDGGVLKTLEDLCARLGVTDAVIFQGPKPHSEISDQAVHASFYLQTSKYEGMAVSVVEAMQLGLVAVVTPVGEIINYGKSGVNMLFVEADHKIVEDVIILLNDRVHYHTICRNAIETWTDFPLYHESIIAACEALASNKE
jgi:glycosyltransferase involved in cell wall biosynthesis